MFGRPHNVTRKDNMNRSIYVVDDEALLLESLVLVLRTMGRDWEVTGFNDPLAALAAIKAKTPDAVLTDQMMPGMMGSQLLEQVRIASPTAVRLIMSGYVAFSKLSLITSAHQYIAKPFDLGKLRELMQRSFATQERIINQGLQDVVTSLRSIPSLPHSHNMLLAELKNDESPSGGIARLVGTDPGLSIKVLQLANSPLFGRGYLVTDVIDAVNCLGTDMITAVILSQSVFQHYESLKHRGIDLARVWTHCWETACLAQHICREKKLPRQTGEEAFLAGMLHEVGRFLLIDNFPDQYQAAGVEALHAQVPLSAQLRKVFQANPSQLSAYVLELWGLPAAVIDGISFMDNPEEDPAQGFSMTSALYIAHHLASRTFPADTCPEEDWKTGYLESIGCVDDISSLEKLFTKPKDPAICCMAV
jgi:HD-like signal output (HDOD) protein